MSEEVSSRESNQQKSGGSDSTQVKRSRSGQPAGFGLKLYKPGQGYYTRMGTAIGLGVLGVAGAAFLFDQLGNLALKKQYQLSLQYGISFGFVAALGILAYWLAGLNRKTNDFFIATEGEMKKVRWSTRKEVVHSTKVVIVTVAIMGVGLFFADILFMLFFSWIKVLRVSPMLERLFGSES